MLFCLKNTVRINLIKPWNISKPIRIVISAFSIFLFLCIGVWLFSRTQRFQAHLNPFIQKQISHLLSGSVSWEDLRLSFPFGVSIIHPVIFTLDKKPIISCVRVTARISLLPLLIKRIDIGNIIVQSPKVIYEYGKYPNLGNVFVSPVPRNINKSSAWAITIHNYKVNSGQFTYRDSLGHIDASVNGIFVNGSLSSSSGISAKILGLDGHADFGNRSFSIDSLSCLFFITNHVMTIKDAHVNLMGHTRINGSFELPLEPSGKWKTDISAITDNLFLKSLSIEKWGFNHCSSLAINVQSHGTHSLPFLSLDLNAGGIDFRNISLKHLNLKGVCDSLGKVSILLSPNDSSISGTVRLTGRISDSENVIDVKNYNIAAKLGSENISGLTMKSNKTFSRVQPNRGVARLEGVASGPSLRQLPTNASAVIEFNGIAFPNREGILPAGRITALFKEDRLEFTGEWPDNFMFKAKGRFGKNNIDADADFKIIAMQNIAGLILGQEIYGKMSGTVKLQATQKTTQFEVNTEAPEISWKGLRLTNAKVDLRYEPSGIWNVVSSSGKFQGDLSGPLSFFGFNKFGGSINGSITADGPLSMPDASAKIVIKDFSFGIPIASMISGTLDFHKGALSIEELRLTQDSLRLTGAISYDFQKQAGTTLLSTFLTSKPSAVGIISAQVILAKDTIRKGNLTISKAPLGLARTWVKGVALPHAQCSTSVSFEGAFSNPSAKAFIMLNGNDSAERKQSNLNIWASLSEHKVAAKCTLRVSDPCAALSGSANLAFSSLWNIDTALAAPVTIRIFCKDMCLKPFSQAFLPGASLDGTLSSDVEMLFQHGRWYPFGSVNVSSGKLSIPGQKLTIDNINARLEPVRDDSTHNKVKSAMIFVSTGAIAYQGLVWSKSMLNGTFSHNTLIIDSAFVKQDSGGLSFKGAMPLISFDHLMKIPGIQLSFSADHFLLKGLNPIIPGGKFISGYLDGQVIVAPTVNSFFKNGSLKMKDVVFAPDEISPPIGPVSASLGFAGDSVVLRTFSGTWGKGLIKAGGFTLISSNAFGRTNIDIAMNSFPIDLGDDYRFLVDSLRTTIANTNGKWRVNGDVLLGKSNIFKEILFNQPVMVSLNTKKTIKESPVLNVTVRIPKNLTADVEIGQFITGAPLSISARLGGNLLFHGTISDPEYTGSVNIVDGTITYLDNTFIISNGYVRMSGGTEMKPLISLFAKTGIKQAQGGTLKDSIEITLQVSGELNNPTIKLLSSPVAYSEPEIMSLLTFGTINAGNKLGNSASAVLVKTISAYASRQAQKGLGLDEVQFQGNPFSSSVASTATVSVSKKIGPTVTLSYRRSITNNFIQEGVLSWKILSFLFLESETDAQGNAGIDLKIKVEK